MRRALAATLLALVLPAAPARAQDTLTPDGPATLRATWLGASTLEGRPPEVLVGWTVTVGPGGQAGNVRLRVFKPGEQATVVGSGPPELLPADPGTYRFELSPGIPYDYRDHGLALDQETGGHMIVQNHPSEPEKGEFADPYRLHALDVWRPPPADDAQDVPYEERRQGQELLLGGVIERDVDRDRLGDESRDGGDLQLLGAAAPQRRGRDVLLTARVRNAGTTVRDLPYIVRPAGTGKTTCIGPKAFNPWLDSCPGQPLAPGAIGRLSMWVELPEDAEPDEVHVASESTTDATPADNVRRIAPRLEVAARRSTAGVLRVAVRSSQAGRVTVMAHVASLRLTRTVRFAGPGRRVVRLLPARARDRERLAAALERNRRLTARLSATLRDARATARVRL